MITVIREIVASAMRTVRRSTWWWGVGVSGFVIVNLAFWPSLEDSEALEAFGEMDELLKAFGAQNIATPSGYMDGQVFALLLPLLLSAMSITMVSGMTAGDENAGRLELLHALPVTRRAVWTGRWGAAMIMVTIVSLVGAVSTLVCMPLFSLTEVSVTRVLGAVAGCALLAAFHGSLSYMIAGWGGSRGLSAGVGIAVLVVGYLAAFVLPINASLAGARRWSPWYWAIGEQPVTNGVQPGWMLLVGAITAALVVLGTRAVDHRDIHTA